MDDDWESVADKEIGILPKPSGNINKWDGEDEDDEVKDSWEDEEEKKDEEKVETKTMPAKLKPNKALKSKIDEMERLSEEQEANRIANMTAEEKLAEKLRLEKVQKESDLKSALETFGVSSIGNSLDVLDPHSKEDFKEFGERLSWKISQYKESPHFPQFVEDFVRSICVNLSATDMKKVKICIENLHSEKVKLEKQGTKKGGGKGKGKASIRGDINDIEDYQKYGTDYVADDYDDFM